jgi:hypothetical protein
VLTATGTQGEAQAEIKTTFDGTTLRITGDTIITGSLSAASKSFDIPHPSKEGFRLRYGVLEGPEHGVYVRGIANSNIITLPDHWINLIDYKTISVQLTSVGSHQELYFVEVKNNDVIIGSNTSNINCYYFIQAERIDVEKLKIEY